mgnify:CR=1 FL=1
MARLVQSDVHVDKVLTAFSVGYQNTMYVAGKVFPTVTMDKESDVYFKYDRGDAFRDVARERAAATDAVDVGMNVSTATVSTKEYANRTFISRRTIENADKPLNLLQDHTAFLLDKLDLAKEVKFAADFMVTGKWETTKTLSGTSQWSDHALSDPLGDIDVGVEAVIDGIGQPPNVGIITRAVWSKLKRHPDLLDAVKYTQQGGMISLAQLAALTDIPTWYVAGAIKTSSNEGATDTTAGIFGKTVLLLYVPPTPGLRTPAAGYTFAREAKTIKRWYDNGKEAEAVQASENYGMEIVAKEAGYLFLTAVA